jgi:hypothetical protein
MRLRAVGAVQLGPGEQLLVALRRAVPAAVAHHAALLQVDEGRAVVAPRVQREPQGVLEAARVAVGEGPACEGGGEGRMGPSALSTVRQRLVATCVSPASDRLLATRGSASVAPRIIVHRGLCSRRQQQQQLQQQLQHQDRGAQDRAHMQHAAW